MEVGHLAFARLPVRAHGRLKLVPSFRSLTARPACRKQGIACTCTRQLAVDYLLYGLESWLFPQEVRLATRGYATSTLDQAAPGMCGGFVAFASLNKSRCELLWGLWWKTVGRVTHYLPWPIFPWTASCEGLGVRRNHAQSASVLSVSPMEMECPISMWTARLKIADSKRSPAQLYRARSALNRFLHLQIPPDAPSFPWAHHS